MPQVSKIADEKLNSLSRSIGKADKLIIEATAEKVEAWNEVFEIIDEFSTDPRFIANDGFSLVRQARQGAPRLDQSMLYEKLKEAVGEGAKLTRLWNSITEEGVRTVNPVLLDVAIKRNQIDQGLANSCTTTPEVTYARVRRAWTKEDREKAALYGIEFVEEEGE